MGEFKNPSEQQNKTATPVKAPEEVGSLGEMEYVDTRASTAQLISLQAAADGRGNRSTTTQLKTKAWNFSGNSRIAQLQTLGEARTTSSNTAPIQRAENKTGLPDQLKSGMESISGMSLGDVKVHRNSDKPAQLQAHAYAQGTDIHLGPGQEKYLPHELGHVVQQKQGRVQPTTQLQAKVNINDDAGLEKEADVLGAKAMQFKTMPGFQAAKTASAFSSNTFQLALKKLAAEDGWNKKGDKGSEKIDRREDDQWPIGPINKDEKSVQDTTDIVTENKLDDDLWFKSSPGMNFAESTEEHLPTYDQGIPSAFHVTTHEKSAKSILNRIDPRMHNPASRFGGGFYVATELTTSYAEIAAHEFDNFKEGGDPTKGLLTAIHILEYTGMGTTDLVDATTTPVLKTMVQKEPLKIEKKVRQEGRDGIVFNSTKGAGKNIVFYKNYGALKLVGTGFRGAADGFKEWKESEPTETL